MLHVITFMYIFAKKEHCMLMQYAFKLKLLN